LLLALFLGLVLLGILVVESLRAPRADEPAAAAGLSSGEDTLVLRLGRVPEPGEAPPGGEAAAAPPAGAEAPAPAPDPTAAPAMSPDEYYVVKPGDTLSSIAREQLGSPLLAGELARINRLADPNQLEVGQILYLH
jgi:nucleoid-associated protein YgaU